MTSRKQKLKCIFGYHNWGYQHCDACDNNECEQFHDVTCIHCGELQYDDTTPIMFNGMVGSVGAFRHRQNKKSNICDFRPLNERENDQ